MRIYTGDEQVIAEGVKYLRIVGISYLFTAVTQVYLYIMRSIERVVIATVVYSLSLLTNICINAVLIFGLFGFPEMGIAGAAIGTLAARILELAVVIWYGHVKTGSSGFISGICGRWTGCFCGILRSMPLRSFSMN